MSEPFLAEIRIVSFNFAPRGWAFCDGQTLPISQNQSLYSLLRTTYGGDGRTNFALPDLRGRVPIHRGSSNGTNHQLGDRGGVESHTLSGAETPAHRHPLSASRDDADPALTAQGNVLAKANIDMYREPSASLVPLDSRSVTAAGGGQAHTNLQPYLVLEFCIALQGLFPSRN